MIPKFVNSKNISSYHLALTELVAKIDDSHAQFKSPEITKYFGVSKLPIKCEYAEGKLIITKILNDSLATENDLKIGDIIEEIDAKKITTIVNELSKYIPASNNAVKIRNLTRDNYFIRGTKDYLKLKIQRDGVSFEKNCKLHTNKEINYDYKNIKPASQKWNIIENNIGFVNIGVLEKSDVDKMFSELMNTKAIIFDYRHYPNSTAHFINMFISEKQTVFWSMLYPDLSYPGYYIWEKNIKTKTENKNIYKGKVILLVNENSQSQSEFASMLLRSNPNVTIIGSQTSGADGNISKFKIANIATCFSGLGVFYPDGSETQRIGIIPDVEVKPTLKGIKENRDEYLEKAIDFINKK